MRKTSGVTKYEVRWQLVRSSVKGKKTPLKTKLEMVRRYYEESRTYDRWERCFNWLEGLSRGYKAHLNNTIEDLLSQEFSYYRSCKEESLRAGIFPINQEKELRDLRSASDSEVSILLKDLCTTNIKWLKKGYLHRECNDFLDFIILNKPSLVDDQKIKQLNEARAASQFIENKHNFFF